jgi:DNA-binding NtrC family response regulator
MQEIVEALALVAGELELERQNCTLYLDDFRVLDDAAQAQLLAILGSPFVRVITSTRRDLWADVRAGRLRPELHQRLAALPIVVPALGERGAAAIETLALRVLRRLRIESGEGPEGFTPAALDLLCGGRWPGNVPQLRDVLTEAFVRAVGVPLVDAHHLTRSLIARGLHASTARVDAEDWSLAAVEKRHLLTVLRMCDDNRSQAARLLGITRTTLYKKLAEYGVSDAD